MRTLLERFEDKYVAEPNTGCWLWTAALNDAGYGRLGVTKGWRGAHRVAYELFVGTVPQDMFVCHRCDTPACVNPSHLFLGRPIDNTADMIAKGRIRTGRLFGDSNPNGIVGSSQLGELRALAMAGATSRQLAERYGISVPHARDLMTGRRRKVDCAPR
jgi:hypothetical protein